MNLRKNKKGFTLTEVMIAAAIGVGIMTATSIFFIQVYRNSFVAADSLKASHDIRTFTSKFTVIARESAKFYIYKSFTDRTPVADGETGDFAVFFARKRPVSGTLNWSDSAVNYRLVGYYRSVTTTVNGEDVGPVRVFDVPIADIKDPLKSLPNANQINAYPEIIELASGKAYSKSITNDGVVSTVESKQGQLFLNFNNRSVIVRGELNQKTRMGKTITNTYNYTVTPRG